MQKLLASALLLVTPAPFCVGQGWVMFSTGAPSRISTNNAGITSGFAAAYNGASNTNSTFPIPGVSWYYELFVATTIQTTIDASLSGWTPVFLGTNLVTPGRLAASDPNAGDPIGIPVPGAAPGDIRNFAVVGWSANLGSDWNAVFAGRPSTLVTGTGNGTTPVTGAALWSTTTAPAPKGWTNADLTSQLGTARGLQGAFYGISPVALNIYLASAGGPYNSIWGANGQIPAMSMNYYTVNCAGTPVITGQPTTQVVGVGQSATFSVFAGCATAYQWLMDGTNLAGATNRLLVVTNVQPANGGVYAVIVTNLQGGITSAPAVLNVGQPIPGLYSTGVDSGGRSLPGGSTDPHWNLGGNATGPAVVLGSTNLFGQWTADTTNSSWIAIHDSTTEPTNVPYSFDQTFDLTGFDLSRVFLWGTWWGDDSTSLLLNRHVITNSALNLSGLGWAVNGQSGWFNSGTNTLSIEMNASDGNWDGVRLELTGVIGQTLPAATAVYARPTGVALLIKISDLLTNVTDPGGSPISLIGVGTDGVNLLSTNGATLFTNSTYVLYTNSVSPNVNDRFTYNVRDVHGQPGFGTVLIVLSNNIVGQTNVNLSVTSSNVTANFFGVPGYRYTVERSTNLTQGLGWVPISTNTAPAGGLMQAIDNFRDLGLSNPPPSSYYRLRYSP
ncbi:MAG: hypothetical protein C5B50_08400 [Verrucomicrobia bacterium]|nr:MAG: hypothetical protein C5B50_08400 [Verrucomicrobiota bacterium]